MFWRWLEWNPGAQYNTKMSECLSKKERQIHPQNERDTEQLVFFALWSWPLGALSWTIVSLSVCRFFRDNNARWSEGSLEPCWWWALELLCVVERVGSHLLCSYSSFGPDDLNLTDNYKLFLHMQSDPHLFHQFGQSHPLLTSHWRECGSVNYPTILFQLSKHGFSFGNALQ